METFSNDLWLWLSLLGNIFLYILIGKFYISQPSYNRPALFYNPIIAVTLSNLPFVGFIAVIIFGFLATNNGLWFLFASIASFIAFSVKPQSF